MDNVPVLSVGSGDSPSPAPAQAASPTPAPAPAVDSPTPAPAPVAAETPASPPPPPAQQVAQTPVNSPSPQPAPAPAQNAAPAQNQGGSNQGGQQQAQNQGQSGQNQGQSGQNQAQAPAPAQNQGQGQQAAAAPARGQAPSPNVVQQTVNAAVPVAVIAQTQQNAVAFSTGATPVLTTATLSAAAAQSWTLGSASGFAKSVVPTPLSAGQSTSTDVSGVINQAGDSNGGSSSGGVSGAAIGVPVALVIIALLAVGTFFTRKWWQKKQAEKHRPLMENDFVFGVVGSEKRPTDSEFWDTGLPSDLMRARSPSISYIDHAQEMGGAAIEKPSFDEKRDSDPFRGASIEHLRSAPAGLGGSLAYPERPADAHFAGRDRTSFDRDRPESFYSTDSAIAGPAPAYLTIDDARDSVLDAYGSFSRPEPPQLTVSAPSDVDDQSVRDDRTSVATTGTRKSLRWSAYMPWTSSKDRDDSQPGQAL